MDAKTTIRLLLVAAGAVVVGGGCGEEAGEPEGLAELHLVSAGPLTVLKGTALTVSGTGFVTPQIGEMTIELQGAAGTLSVDVEAPLVYVDDQTARWTVTALFLDPVAAAGAPFTGTLTVRRRVFGYSGWDDASLSVTITAATNLQPVLAGLEQDAAWAGDPVRVAGDGFLMVEEGQSLLFVSGTFKVDSPPMEKTIQSVAIPLSVETRTSAVFELAPDKFGINPGTLTAALRVENHVDGVSPLVSSELSGVQLALLPPMIESFSPDTVRRGQKVTVTGKGFVPPDAFKETATIIMLDGVFKMDDGKEMGYQGKDAMLLFPEQFTTNSLLEVVLRVTLDLEGKPQGLGLVPGIFSGTAFPEVFWGGESFLGAGFDFTVRVAPQLQVVYVKYLPSFDEAFGEFGLKEVAALVKARILERCNRDYSAFNVQFVDVRPADYAEYSVVELAGEDPNGANLLGLDNTTGKDNGNLRFNDIIGGKNAETEEQGYYAYGGVFLKSFLLFSPTYGVVAAPLASKRFDGIFGTFVPKLGGAPVEAGEYPGGSRDAAIAQAVLALGNLIGGTVAHEIGHSLGLAMVPGHEQEYHNIGDNPAWLMDEGNYRPFDERCEIDGKGPEVFAPYDFDYLSKILPKG